MKKPLFNLLICFALIAALISVGICFGSELQEDDPEAIGEVAEDVTEILTVSITGITEPEPDAVPAGIEALTADSCTITACAWLDRETMQPAAAFEGGRSYVLKITCEPAEGCAFTGETAAFFNGSAAVTDAPGVFSCTYVCPEPTPIPSVNIYGIAVPMAGAVPAKAESFVCSDEQYSIVSASWTDRAGNAVESFTDGQKYTLTVTFAPAKGYRFADTKATFNGKAAQAGADGSWSLVFTCGAFNGSDCGNDQTVCPAAQFLDAPKHGNWAHAGIDYCIDLGLMNGVGSGVFKPNGTLTRAQLVTILYRVAGNPKVGYTGAFKDVKPNLWYSNAIEWAAANGIVNGTQPGIFAPTNPVTREQIATILYRYSNVPAFSGNLNAFPDKSSVHDYAVEALTWATGAGYINGISTNGVVRLSPRSNATRAQIASIIMRCLEDYKRVYRHDDTAPYSKLKQSFDVYYATQKLSIPVECMGNRPYIALESLAEIPVTQPSDEDLADLHWAKMKHLDKIYITLADAASICHLGVEFRESDSTVRLYKLQEPKWNTTPTEGTDKTAYIRLEDIMADYGTNGRFTHDSLIKLRAQADYLNACTDGYYIAWIPLYVNPELGIQNNISTYFSFYNADFVFTLDYMILHGGHLGLHGLTHQSGNAISADGFEFGKDNTYTTEELLDRFREAEAISNRLGYSYEFFEFSHYDATEEQKKVAENFFGIVAQSRDGSNLLERKYTLMHDCLWMPTPAGHVQSAYDREGINQRLDQSYAKGYDISLFFHPVLDNRYFGFSIKGDTMTVTMDDQYSFLATIIAKIGGWGYKFGEVPAE